MWEPAVEAESDCGVECGGGGYLIVSESESEKCEPWGM